MMNVGYSVPDPRVFYSKSSLTGLTRPLPQAGGDLACGRMTKWRREGFANKNTLARHIYALPVGFDQCFAGQIMADDNGRMRKLLWNIARFDHGSITSRCACFQPAKRTHLTAADEHAPSRGEVVGNSARRE